MEHDIAIWDLGSVHRKLHGFIKSEASKRGFIYYELIGQQSDSSKSLELLLLEAMQRFEMRTKINILLSRKANAFFLYVLPMIEKGILDLEGVTLYIVFEGHPNVFEGRWGKCFLGNLDEKKSFIEETKMKALRFMAYGRNQQHDPIDRFAQPESFVPILKDDLRELDKNRLSERTLITFHSNYCPKYLL